MKKIVLLFSLVFAISFSAVCAAASNASILGNEEKAVDKFLAVLYKNNGTYEEFAPNLTPGLQKRLMLLLYSNCAVRLKITLEP